MKKTTSIGIDFGTTNCSVSAIVNGFPTILEIEDGKFNEDKKKMKTILSIKDRMEYTPNDKEIEIERRNIIKKHNEELQAIDSMIDNIISNENIKIHVNQKEKIIKKINKKINDAMEFCLIHKKTNTIQELEQKSNNARQIIKKLNDKNQLTERAIKSIIKNKTNKNDETILEILKRTPNDKIIFGKEAYIENLKNQDEFSILTSSPKNFIGTKLSNEALETLELILIKFLSHLRQKANKILNSNITKTVIAIPIEFHTTKNNQEEGNQQAKSLLKRAAKKSGFLDINFILEPIAAAFTFEQKLKKQTKTLIVDLGGGTSDIAFLNLKSNNRDIFSVKGLRFGGNNIDQEIAKTVIKEPLGFSQTLTSGLPIPTSLFFSAIATNNYPEQKRFYSNAAKSELAQIIRSCNKNEASKLEIMQEIQNSYQTTYVMNEIEDSKIKLSEIEKIEMILSFSNEKNTLKIKISQKEIESALSNWLDTLFKLIDNCIKDNEKPEVIYLTGGIGLLPQVQKALKSRYKIPMVLGDTFGAIAIGAALQADKL